MANMNDVAKVAGVSKSTVSKVINNYDNLSDDTIRKVNKAIKELGYVRNASASSLSKKDVKKIGILLKVNDIEHVIDEIYMHYLLGVDAACTEDNIEYSIIFTNTVENKSCDELITYLYSKSITSIIIIGLAKDDDVLNDLVNRQVFPVVVSEARIRNKLTSSVGINNLNAQYEIVKNAVEHHQPKSILYIEGKANGFVSEYRKSGLIKACEEYNISPNFFNGQFSEEVVFNYLSDCQKQYDMIVCASDLMAIGARRALTKRNQESNILGFDGINLLSYIASDIQTVKQDFYQIARVAVAEAIRLQNGQASQIIDIPYEIMYLRR